MQLNLLDEPAVVEPTEEEIMNGCSKRGGYTRAQLERWGVPWPPPKGWRRRLVEVSRSREKKPL